MILSALGQGSLFFGSAAIGFSLAFFYDLFRTARRIIPHNKVAVHIEDIIYWIIVLIVMFWFLLNLNSGEIRFFSIAGAFIGMALYMYALSALFMKASLGIYSYLRKIILLLVSIIMAPINLIIYFLSYPANFFAKKIKGMYNYEKKVYNAVKVRSRHKAKKLRDNLRIVLKKF